MSFTLHTYNVLYFTYNKSPCITYLGKFAGSLLVKILLAHSLSYAIQRRQLLIERDVDLHVVLDCFEKKMQIFDDRSEQIHL